MPPTICVHCHRRKVTQSRGLCKPCHKRPEIRLRYPLLGRIKNSNWNDTEPTQEEVDRMVAEQLPTMPPSIYDDEERESWDNVGGQRVRRALVVLRPVKTYSRRSPMRKNFWK